MLTKKHVLKVIYLKTQSRSAKNKGSLEEDHQWESKIGNSIVINPDELNKDGKCVWYIRYSSKFK